MPIRINPPVPPPELSGPAIAAAILHHVQELKRAPTAEELIGWTDWRQPNGRARLAEATSIIASAVLDVNLLFQHFPLLVEKPGKTKIVERTVEKIVEVKVPTAESFTTTRADALTEKIMDAIVRARDQSKAAGVVYRAEYVRSIIREHLHAIVDTAS
tara:strand:+ start:39 stop:512 length:474 start_codon:yes stop_codon:yes gene_type:complete